MHNYHDIPALNASGINVYCNHSPLHFWKQSAFNAEREKQEPTPAMVMGSLAHCLVLEPDSFDSDFALAPETDRRTKEGKQLWQEFQAKANGRMIVTAEQYAHAAELREALFANPAVKKLLGNGCSEHPVTWRREEGGMLCKAKIDYLRAGLLIDYKTTDDASPKAFARSIANFGYHRQMAWYMEAAEQTLGERPRGAVLIVQEKAVPEAIGIYSLSPEALAAGEEDCDYAYNGIKERLRTGVWEAYIDPAQPIQEISLPH